MDTPTETQNTTEAPVETAIETPRFKVEILENKKETIYLNAFNLNIVDIKTEKEFKCVYSEQYKEVITELGLVPAKVPSAFSLSTEEGTPIMIKPAEAEDLQFLKSIQEEINNFNKLTDEKVKEGIEKIKQAEDSNKNE